MLHCNTKTVISLLWLCRLWLFKNEGCGRIVYNESRDSGFDIPPLWGSEGGPLLTESVYIPRVYIVLIYITRFYIIAVYIVEVYHYVSGWLMGWHGTCYARIYPSMYAPRLNIPCYFFRLIKHKYLCWHTMQCVLYSYHHAMLTMWNRFWKTHNMAKILLSVVS